MHTTFAPQGMSASEADEVLTHLQQRLVSMVDMSLTLKHAHWNVVGPGFLAVHELFDRQVAQVRDMADELAERIATLGGIPNGLAGGLVETRTWDDYPVGRAVVEAHLGALDKVYDGMIGDHRKAIHAIEPVDVVTADLLTEQARSLELMQWFVRAHIENTSGELATAGEPSRLDAAAAAATADPLE
jgi:starvation-inducible DNA-binding protein